MSAHNRSLLRDEIKPLSLDEISRFNDQFTSVLLRRCLKTIELQREELRKQREELQSLRGLRPAGQIQKNGR